MKIEAFLTLQATLDRGSFAAAAEAVNLTPSAVSLQIKQLEAYFGQSLFDRSGRTVRPTRFALLVIDTVSRTFSDLEKLRTQRDPSLSGRVRLGVTGSIQTTLLPRAVAELQKRAPGLTLQLERANTPEMLSSLKADRLDAAILVRPPGGGSARLHWKDLLCEPLVLVVPANLESLEPEQYLRRYSWLRLDRKLVVGRMAARYVDNLIPHCEALIDVPSADAIIAMVGIGLGVSVLPRLRKEHLGAYPVREVSLGPAAPTRQLSMVRRKQDSENALLRIIEQAFELACR
ncbi:LysR family transcriptional regulator [Pseudomonas sp. MH9.3]|uniref:LysR family transcriptional regulator n=1 Tax=Pseudomonas sp. MH9.3 TaxID=3048630 RepID=UPI002AC8FAB4|nr:LysR family transcriptional regulator [Pseudomonas sp. MH9.3]MEB0107054.1 LysR family transcriptional regulator [Pseudomonas sp. MH9.3]WPX80329.1 LysR family transcriptional regulator [Pseudomonas sp. MH9.3]WQG57705.1 LysR family transcriptional regulator [Pseudomonas sp. RTB3]